jgi:hypothetical protein
VSRHILPARRLALAVAASVGCISLVGAANPASARLAIKATHAAGTVACRPSDLSATIVITPVGGSSSSLAGAIVFANSSSTACALRGVPKVAVVNPGGQAIDVSQVPDFVRHKPRVVVPASPSSARLADAGTSITWSNWSCAKGSFALVVKFAGWSDSLTVPWGSTTGYAGAPCVGEQAALYVGPITRIAAPQ